MDIILDKNWAIRSDEYNFTLEQRKIAGADAKEPGKESRTAVAYCGRLEIALNMYVKKALGTSPAADFKEVLGELARLNAVVKQVGKEFIAKFPPPTVESKGNDKGKL